MDDDRDAYRILQVRPEADHIVIRAAYRALAAIYHPDRDPSPTATRRMAELNFAFSQVRTAELRAAYDRGRQQRAPRTASEPAVVVPPRPEARPATAPPPGGAGASGPGIIDFGRYAGWSISQLARHDPDYLRWLSRHSSGIRFRRQIESVLKAAEGGQAASAPSKGRR